MKIRIIATAVLLAFVAASVAFIIVKESRRETPSNKEETQSAVGAAQVPAATGDRGAGAAQPPAAIDERAGKGQAVQNGIIAYYFHGTRRCPTCRKLEAYSREAIETGFAEEMKDGKLVWRVVNVEDPGNEHYVRDYGLSTKSVILVAVNDGKEERWKNLSRIWELVGDKTAFITYVQGELEDFEEGR